MHTGLPKSLAHIFAAQAFRALAGVCIEAVCQEGWRQPESTGNPLDGIKAWDALPLLQKQHRLAIE